VVVVVVATVVVVVGAAVVVVVGAAVVVVVGAAVVVVVGAMVVVVVGANVVVVGDGAVVVDEASVVVGESVTTVVSVAHLPFEKATGRLLFEFPSPGCSQEVCFFVEASEAKNSGAVRTLASAKVRAATTVTAPMNRFMLWSPDKSRCHPDPAALWVIGVPDVRFRDVCAIGWSTHKPGAWRVWHHPPDRSGA
jgi:hypothetical protein